jgi:Tfp pilus assembly protein PilF
MGFPNAIFLTALLLVSLAGPAVADGRQEALELNARGVAAVRRGALDEAIRLFVEARKRLPSDPTLRSNLAATHARRARKMLQDGERAKALADLRWAVHFDPENARYRIELALTLAEDRDLAEARKQLELILVRDPENAEALEQLGHIHYRQNDLDGAIRVWKRSLAIRPDRPALAALLEKAERERKVESGMRQDTGAHFAITFDGERNEPVARAILEILEGAYTTVGFELRHYPRERVQVILYTREQFRNATESRSWVGGLFDGKIRLPVRGRNGREEELRRTAVHEYVHVVVRDLAPRCPVWINEGLAQVLEGVRLESSERRVLAGAREGKLLTFKELRRPFVSIEDAERAAIAYAQAHSLLAWLGREAGRGSYADYLQAMSRGKSWAEAFESTFRMKPDEAWLRWAEHLKQRVLAEGR